MAYTYKIINLHANAMYNFNTLEDVLYWWIRNNRWDDKANLPDFSNLNMSGNDTVFFGYFDKNGRPKLFLRPYIVVDQDNRIVDIRDISQRKWEEVRNKPFASRYIFRHNGAKVRMRGRAHLGSLLRNSIQQHGTMTFNIDDETDELDIKLPQPKRVVFTASSDANAKLFVRRTLAENNDSPVCWKKNSKARKQWGKHMDGTAAGSIRTLNRKKMEAEEEQELKTLELELLDEKTTTDALQQKETSDGLVLTEQDILEGLKDGRVKLVENQYSAGTVCQIGCYWFYFGGQTAEDLTPEEYLQNVPMKDIAQEIAETLSDFRKHENFIDEYLYYFHFLREHSA